VAKRKPLEYSFEGIVGVDGYCSGKAKSISGIDGGTIRLFS
jgi:hypothetical protein